MKNEDKLATILTLGAVAVVSFEAGRFLEKRKRPKVLKKRVYVEKQVDEVENKQYHPLYCTTEEIFYDPEVYGGYGRLLILIGKKEDLLKDIEHIFYSEHIEAIKALIKDNNSIGCHVPYEFSTYSYNYITNLIIIKDNNSDLVDICGVATHEIRHYVDNLFSSLYDGPKFLKREIETPAYIQEYLFKQVYSVLEAMKKSK